MDEGISKELQERLKSVGWDESTLRENQEKAKKVLEYLLDRKDQMETAMELFYKLDEIPITQTCEHLVHDPINPNMHKIYSNRDLIEQIKLDLIRNGVDADKIMQIVEKGYWEEKENGCECPRKRAK